MKSKSWYKSKAILAGAAVIIITAYNVIIPICLEEFNIILPAIPEWIYALLAALGIYGRKVANTIIK